METYSSYTVGLNLESDDDFMKLLEGLCEDRSDHTRAGPSPLTPDKSLRACVRFAAGIVRA